MACLYYNKQGNNVCHHNTSKMIYHRAWGGGGGDKSFTSIMMTHTYSFHHA